MSHTDELAALEPACSPEAAIALFDKLPAVRAEDILGRWKGRELATGHPMDGRLVASRWYGKQFDSTENVHPLLFQTPSGELFAGNPSKMPLNLADKISPDVVSKMGKFIGLAKPLISTKKYTARLRNIEHRGVVTAAMVYDALPIIDMFRQVDDNTLLGVMDLRWSDKPYFFILERD